MWHDNPESLKVRANMIEEDVNQAELADLATAHNADLVELIEKLRSSGTDAVRIIRHLFSLLGWDE